MRTSEALTQYMIFKPFCLICANRYKQIDWDMVQCLHCGRVLTAKRVQTEYMHAGANVPVRQFNNLPEDAIIILQDGGVWRWGIKSEHEPGPIYPGKGYWAEDYYVLWADNFERMSG